MTPLACMHVDIWRMAPLLRKLSLGMELLLLMCSWLLSDLRGLLLLMLRLLLLLLPLLLPLLLLLLNLLLLGMLLLLLLRLLLA